MVEGCRLGWKNRGHHTELVTYGISHHHPRHVPLAYVDTLGTKCFQATDLLFLRRTDRAHVEVDAVLLKLLIGGREEQHRGSCGVTRYCYPRVVLVGDSIPQGFTPEFCCCDRVRAII